MVCEISKYLLICYKDLIKHEIKFWSIFKSLYLKGLHLKVFFNLLTCEPIELMYFFNKELLEFFRKKYKKNRQGQIFKPHHF